MTKNFYINVVKNICNIFNNSFETNYNIQYQSRRETKDAKKLGKNAGGFYDFKTKCIYIFSDVIEAINKKNYNNPTNKNDNGLSYLIMACFHELEHRIQFESPEKLRKQPYFSNVAYDIEKLVMLFDKDFYNNNHDNFYLEIDADIKAINNAENFVKFHNIDGINKEYYDLFKRYNHYRTLNYDLPLFVDKMDKIITQYPQILSDKRYIDNEQILSFYNKDGYFKSTKEMMLTNNILTPYITSSKRFLEGLNIEKLNKQEKNYIIKNINFVLNEHKAKKVILEELYPEMVDVCQQLDGYTHISQAPSSKKANFMFDEKYYQLLEEKRYILENTRDEQEL